MPTNVYDVTFPPDTQLANLLGQDLRNFRLDVQQRMALISGTLANRWNPATDAQPANWTGLLYFATDTQQVFQWNGAAWVDVTTSIRGAFFKDGTAHAHTGTTTEDVIYTVPVPANSLGLNGVLRVSLFYAASAQGAPFTTLRIKFGGSLLTNNLYNTLLTAAGYSITLGNRGAVNSQFLNLLTYQSVNPALSIGTATFAIDTTIAQNLVVTVQNGTNTDTQTFNQLIVELL